MKNKAPDPETDFKNYLDKAGFSNSVVEKEFQKGPPTSGLYYLHGDHLGTGTLVTDSNGETTQFFLNLPFGETMAEQHAGVYNNPYKFNAKELDTETGLYYYGARYYNPRLSIWYGVDPLAVYNPVMETQFYGDGQHNGGVYNQGNLNPYIYCYQNPIVYADPNGKQVNKVIDDIQKLWNDWDPLNRAGHRISGESETTQNRRLAESTLKNVNGAAKAFATKETGQDLLNIALRNPDQKLLKIADLMQDAGDGMSLAGYALTISVVGAEVGVPLAALGNGVSVTGEVLEITVKLSQSDLEGAASKTGWLIAGELVDAGVSKIPGITNSQAKTVRENLSKHILEQNASLKLKAIEKIVDNKKKK